ncbi:hypothetical protein [Amycolatopsis sp. TNS106]|uniref:hypothetical protein n=1 Tax=Amycolatopsis sp. TNS106 TaxID=2861750 RepID=UPI001C55CBBA|nr:hypothetical protein [Amycolatopsis sp. TNS106]QXV57464.1 hypothetical protein CVV72_10980 [Amycolatopsis sp. TNS106]
MNYVLAQAFTVGVVERLRDFDNVALQNHTDDIEHLARTVIPLLTGALRVLLDQHQVDSHGDCAACPRPPWRRRTRCRLPRDLSVLLTDLQTLDPPGGRHALR